MNIHHVGIDYCLTHAGVRNEDVGSCDFAEMMGEFEEMECDLRPLAWIEGDPS